MKSPFSKDRFEHIPLHLYFLPESIVAQLEDSKPSYLIGSRGSGKTTLLKALNWKERLDNEWLRDALGDQPFRGKFVAAYAKLPNIKVRSLDEWLKDTDGDSYAVLFGFYLDLITIEMLSHGVGNLLSRLEWTVQPSHESSTIANFFCEYEYLLTWAELDVPTTVSQCNAAVKHMRRVVEHHARRRQSCKKLLQAVLIPEIGELSRAFGKALTQLAGGIDSKKVDQWHFKVCFDEAECLSAVQQKVVNTIIRVSEWPVSYVISYVGWPNDVSTTQYADLSLQRADRNIIVLDDLKKSQFEDLCDGVATVRVRSHLHRKDISFNTLSVLGRLDLNSLVEELVKRTESQTGKKLQKIACEFADSAWASARSGKASAPYIEGYLASKLQLQPPEAAESDARRQQESAEFRKKIVAAYLSICRELNVSKVPYSSANMVFRISDNCVRDYLSQMHHIFISSELELEKFVTSKISAIIQEQALRDASEEKKLSIPESGVLRPILVGRLVKGLAELTAALQRGDDKSDTHLRSSERGVFVLEPQLRDSADDSDLYQMIEDAGDTGFLRIYKEADIIVAFRVHSSLAPAFGFSYRGAYYPVLLKRDDLHAFLECTTGSELKDASKTVTKRLTASEHDDKQLKLFSSHVTDLWDEMDVDN